MSTDVDGQLIAVDGHEGAEGSQEPVDVTLRKLVALLNINEYCVDQMAVKRLTPGNSSKEHCFDFSPSEIPIENRLGRSFGPGTYEIWVRTDKKVLHKRLRMSISETEAAEARKSPGRRRNRGSGSRGSETRSRAHHGQHSDHNNSLQQEVDWLKTQLSGLQSGVHVGGGSGITHRDLIESEERGYKRAKDTFDLQLSSITDHHKTQLAMIKESKGSESYLDDEEHDADDPAGLVDSIAAIVTPAIEAAATFGEGYRAQKETEHMLARVHAGLPPEPPYEVSGEGGAGVEQQADSEGPGEASGQNATGLTKGVEERIRSTMVSLFAGAFAGDSPTTHAREIVGAFDVPTIQGVFLAPGSLDSLFQQRPDLVSCRPWFESLETKVRDILNKKSGVTTNAKSSEKTEPNSTASGPTKNEINNKPEA